MGWPIALFTTPPDPNLICPICHDVLQEPISLQCHHNFCRACLLSYQESVSNDASKNSSSSSSSQQRKFNFKGVSIMCPTCRHLAVIDDHTDTHNHHASSASTSPIVKGLIDNMDVRCRHQLDHEESLAEQLQQGGKEKCGSGSSSSNNDTTTVTATADSLQVKYAQVTNCNWTGNLSEYPSHLESNSCPLQKIHCLGCNSLHMRGYLKSGYCHNSACVVLAARSVLEKKDRMDANEVCRNVWCWRHGVCWRRSK